MLRRAATALILVCLAIPVVAASASAGPPDPSDYLITAKAKLSGTPQPYRFALQSESNPTSQITDFRFTRTAGSGRHPVQSHQWTMSPSHTACTAGLHSCRIWDAGGFAPFGAFDLRFAPTARATTSDVVCGGVVVGTLVKRPGALTGTLRIKTGTSYFGVIRNSGTHVRLPNSIPATGKITIPNGEDCGPIDLGPCVTEIGMYAFGLDSTFFFGVRRAPDPAAYLQIGVQDDTGTKVVSLQHQVEGSVPKTAFKVTSNDPLPLQRARVAFAGLAPFAAGSARFDPTDVPTDPEDCSQIQREGTLHGSVTMAFDGFGARTFTTAAAILYRSHA